ncbi:MAG: glycosyltransferase [Thainema sp.]
MSKPEVPVYFYVPRSEWPEQGIPQTPITCWTDPNLWPSAGKYDHTIQTYLRLSTSGFPCQIIDQLPTEGIVIAHYDLLPKHPKLLNPKLLAVCIKAERTPHPYAAIHVVQNPEEARFLSGCWNAHFIPFWLQQGLIPRDSQRGNRFENIAFFGRKVNLAPELKSDWWLEQLSDLGLCWILSDEPELWSDYSNIDAVLAVRSFDQQTYSAKPANKLFNAWHTGVPAIVGNDSAFQAEFHNELDFIKVTTVHDAIAALKRLKEEPELRRAMIENGFQRAKETEPDAIVKRWQAFIEDVAIPAYERQRLQSGISQTFSFIKRCFATVSRRDRTQALPIAALSS